MLEFLKPKTEYKVLHVQALERPAEPNKDIRDAVATLAGHPGFQWLLTKLRYQKAVLESKLHTERYDNIQDYHLLQSGIIWLKYLEDTVDREITHVTKPVEDIPKSFRPSIEDLRRHIEFVGKDNPS